MTERRLRLHFVWTGRHFPYHARLAVESAIVAEPEASIEMHIVGAPPMSVDFDIVRRRSQVTTRVSSLATVFEGCPTGPAPLLELVQRIPHGAASALSNLVRLSVLWERGGVYVDTDVLVLRPLARPDAVGAFVGQELVWADNRQRVAGDVDLAQAFRSVPWAIDWSRRRLDCKLANGAIGLAGKPPIGLRLQVNNAVIGAPAYSPFIGAALEAAVHADPGVRYALGPSLLDDVARAHPDTVTLEPPANFYAVPPGQSYRFFEDRQLSLPAEAQVMHYVASNHRRLLRRLHRSDPRFESRPEPFWAEARRVREHIRSSDRTLTR